MSNTLAKNLHQCFPLIKPPKHQLTTSSPHKNTNHHHRHHRDNHHHQPESTTYSKSYNSLFENSQYLQITPSTTSTSMSDTLSDIGLIDTVDPDTPDLTAVYASRRFFISSPGRSNSIIDSLSSTTSSPEEDPGPPLAVVDGVAVETYSPNPYLDFRRSMEEMVVAREVARGVVARGDLSEFWHYLQELLLSYLSLNPKNTHKYIVKAFGDIVINNLSPNNNNNKINNFNYSTTTTTSSSSSPFSTYCSKTNCINY